jgi:cytochrome c biogenesis protein CcmG/thiol:disulfide interchange protein DsbE
MLYQLSYCRTPGHDTATGAGGAARWRSGPGRASGGRGPAHGRDGDARPRARAYRSGAMRRSAVPALLGILAVALVAVLAFALTRSPADEKNERRLDAQVADGTPVVAPGSDRPLLPLGGSAKKTLADYRGQVVVLNFWGSWCKPCKDEAPLLERYHRRLQAAGVGTVVGVTYNDVPRKSIAFEQLHRLTYPSFQDPGTELADQYGAHQMPETFVIDRRGRIHAIARTAITKDFMDGALERAGVPATALTR